MTYTKPDDMKYTTMAIWIDDHVYTDDCDHELLYQYLYHLATMIAYKGSYFNSQQDYDEFGLFFASRLFLRLINKKQFEDPPRLQPIKSILNYIKKTGYACKVDFLKECKGVDESGEVIFVDEFNLADNLVESSSIFDTLSYSFGSDISTLIHNYLCMIPRKKQSAEWTNIYMSCALTLLSYITLPDWVERRYNIDSKTRQETLEKLYRDQRDRKPVLFHLPESMSSYIKVLVNEIIHLIASEMSRQEGEYISAADAMRTVLSNELDKEEQ